MAPRKVIDYGDATHAPDFDFETMQTRVSAFLRDSRDSRRGGKGIDPVTLQFRRLRSAIQHFHLGLTSQPGMPHIQFVWGWDLLRQQIIELQDAGKLPTEGPLFDWIQKAIHAESVDRKARNNKSTNLRRFLLDNDWPVDQAVPPAEVQNKGMGPLQWWRVFAKNRQLTQQNITRWECARRKSNERARKRGDREDSDSDQAARVEDDEDEEEEEEEEEAPPPKPKPKPKPKPGKPGKRDTSKPPADTKKKAADPKKARQPSKAPPTTTKAAASQQTPKTRGASTVPPLRRATDQDPADVVDARTRSRRPAALAAERRSYDDMNEVGADAGDAANDADYDGEATGYSDDEDARRAGKRRQRATSSTVSKVEASEAEEDQLVDDDEPRPSTARSKKGGAKKAAMFTGDFLSSMDIEAPEESASRRKSAKKSSNDKSVGGPFPATFQPIFEPLIELSQQPVSSKGGARAAEALGTPGSAPSWSTSDDKKRKASGSSSRSALSSGARDGSVRKGRVEFEDDSQRRASRSRDDESDGDDRSDTTRERSAPLEREVVEITDSEVEDAAAEDTHSGKGKGKGKAPPKKVKVNHPEQPPKAPGRGVISRELARQEVAPTTDTAIRRATEEPMDNAMDVDHAEHSPYPPNLSQVLQAHDPSSYEVPPSSLATAPPPNVDQMSDEALQAAIKSVLTLHERVYFERMELTRKETKEFTDRMLALNNANTANVTTILGRVSGIFPVAVTPGASVTVAPRPTDPASPAVAQSTRDTVTQTTSATATTSSPATETLKIMEHMKDLHTQTLAAQVAEQAKLEEKLLKEIRLSTSTHDKKIEGVDSKVAALGRGHAGLTDSLKEVREQIANMQIQQNAFQKQQDALQKQQDALEQRTAVVVDPSGATDNRREQQTPVTESGDVDMFTAVQDAGRESGLEDVEMTDVAKVQPSGSPAAATGARSAGKRPVHAPASAPTAPVPEPAGSATAVAVKGSVSTQAPQELRAAAAGEAQAGEAATISPAATGNSVEGSPGSHSPRDATPGSHHADPTAGMGLFAASTSGKEDASSSSGPLVEEGVDQGVSHPAESRVPPAAGSSVTTVRPPGVASAANTVVTASAGSPAVMPAPENSSSQASAGDEPPRTVLEEGEIAGDDEDAIGDDDALMDLVTVPQTGGRKRKNAPNSKSAGAGPVSKRAKVVAPPKVPASKPTKSGEADSGGPCSNLRPRN